MPKVTDFVTKKLGKMRKSFVYLPILFLVSPSLDLTPDQPQNFLVVFSLQAESPAARNAANKMYDKADAIRSKFTEQEVVDKLKSKLSEADKIKDASKNFAEDFLKMKDTTLKNLQNEFDKTMKKMKPPWGRAYTHAFDEDLFVSQGLGHDNESDEFLLVLIR